MSHQILAFVRQRRHSSDVIRHTLFVEHFSCQRVHPHHLLRLCGRLWCDHHQLCVWRRARWQQLHPGCAGVNASAWLLLRALGVDAQVLGPDHFGGGGLQGEELGRAGQGQNQLVRAKIPELLAAEGDHGVRHQRQAAILALPASHDHTGDVVQDLKGCFQQLREVTRDVGQLSAQGLILGSLVRQGVPAIQICLADRCEALLSHPAHLGRLDAGEAVICCRHHRPVLAGARLVHQEQLTLAALGCSIASDFDGRLDVAGGGVHELDLRLGPRHGQGHQLPGLVVADAEDGAHHSHLVQVLELTEAFRAKAENGGGRPVSDGEHALGLLPWLQPPSGLLGQLHRLAASTADGVHRERAIFEHRQVRIHDHVLSFRALGHAEFHLYLLQNLAVEVQLLQYGSTGWKRRQKANAVFGCRRCDVPRLRPGVLAADHPFGLPREIPGLHLFVPEHQNRRAQHHQIEHLLAEVFLPAKVTCCAFPGLH
mmetsp:Transcript_66947/g.159737  ORF Transcript_66947/g.159737 Transcript_66947/m.159737 type:complete len:483 (+) Transcript_66947:1211-2659(+)